MLHKVMSAQQLKQLARKSISRSKWLAVPMTKTDLLEANCGLLKSLKFTRTYHSYILLILNMI